MLVLTRKTQEVIRIGDDIEITVVEVAHNRVRLGISAPRDMPVDRQEIHERKEMYPDGPPRTNRRQRYSGMP